MVVLLQSGLENSVNRIVSRGFALSFDKEGTLQYAELVNHQLERHTLCTAEDVKCNRNRKEIGHLSLFRSRLQILQHHCLQLD